MNNKIRYRIDQVILILILADPLGGIGILFGKGIELGLWMVFIVQLLFLAYFFNHTKTMGSMLPSTALLSEMNKKKSLLSNGPMVLAMTFGLAVFGKMIPMMLYSEKTYGMFDMLVWTVLMGYLVWRFFETEFYQDISGAKETPPLFCRLPYLTAVIAVLNFVTVPFPWSSSTPALEIWGMALADLVMLSLFHRGIRKRIS